MRTVYATRTPPRTTPLCDRCGCELPDARKRTVLCQSCKSVVTADGSERSVKRSRLIAAREGWDFEDPCAGPWGTSSATEGNTMPTKTTNLTNRDREES